MPFRLELEIKSKAARALWTKAISAFHTIADSFKIDIRKGKETGFDKYGRNCYSELVFTSTNKTRTTVICISFKECFFKKFQIEGEISSRSSGPSKNDRQINYADSYTMIVSSQDMNILFKDCGDDSVSWKIFMLSGDELTHMVYSNKLFVEFDTKSGMKKKYSVSYRPSEMTYENRIHYIYLKFLENQQRLDGGGEMEMDNEDEFGMSDGCGDEDEDRVHRIAMDTNIFKQFLQMFPLKLEDMKMEVSPDDGMITFKGYNRQQLVSKDDNIFKKPMSLTIRMRLNTIIYNNIKESAEDKKLQVSFRLRNFKTFIQLINFNYSDFKDYSEDDKDSLNTVRNYNSHATSAISEEGDNVCDIMFSKPGYPIIFERRYLIEGKHDAIECCSVTLTEVTDGESPKISLGGVRNNVNNRIIDLGLSTMRSNNLKRRRDALDRLVLSDPVSIRHTDKNTGVGRPLFVFDDNDDEGGNYSCYNPEFGGIDETGKNDGNVDELFWNNDKFHQSKVVNKSLGTSAGAGKAESQYDDDNNNDGEEEEDFLGPTQKTHFKGIFD